MAMWSRLALACPGVCQEAKHHGNSEDVDAEEEAGGRREKLRTSGLCLSRAVLQDCCAGAGQFCRGRGSSSRIAVAVMRHGERLDAVDPVSWFHSKGGREYPFDCPLSARGRSQVASVARELSQRSCGSFSYVVSSPFVRCIETAVEVCRALGLPICIDMQLGEVFGPACFGDWRSPGPVRRTPEEVTAFVPDDLRKVSPVDAIGQAPLWPESIEDARLRMVARVEQYTDWAARLDGVNFVLVTHGDCVGACLTLALARQEGSLDQVVEKVDYCGYTLLERSFESGEPPIGLLDEGADWQVKHGHVLLRDANLIPEPECLADCRGPRPPCELVRAVHPAQQAQPLEPWGPAGPPRDAGPRLHGSMRSLPRQPDEDSLGEEPLEEAMCRFHAPAAARPRAPVGEDNKENVRVWKGTDWKDGMVGI